MSTIRKKREGVAPSVLPAPRTRDPIVNTVLLGMGANKRGIESFWISTYNRNVGAIGLRLDEWGNCRAYQFPWQHEGFYSSAYVGQDTLWLCGRLDRVVRLNLRTGAFKAYETGAAKARVFEGMIYDKATEKIFVLSQPFHTTRTIAPSVGVSFSIREKRTVRLHEIEIAESVSRVSFPNGDGSYSMNVQIPGESLVRWDPQAEAVESRLLTDVPVLTQGGEEKRRCRLVSDDEGRWYMPGLGWFHPLRGKFEKHGPTPAVEMAWFARRGRRVLGALNEGSDISVHVWDWDTGTITPLVKIPDCDVFNVSVTHSGRLVAVSGFGVFYRFDIATGALEASRLMPTESFGDALAVCQIDDDRIIGTPYVSSRFWELNIRTGKSIDCGRVQTAWGQVSAMTRAGDKTYLAAYGSGELMEYDPNRPLCFPENPRRVADPPGGMRPVTIANDGQNVYYSCANDYGHLGCVVTRYETVAGRARYAINPLGNQQIVSLAHDPMRKSLICGTTFHADSMSKTPTEDTALVAELDAKTLKVKGQSPAPRGTVMIRVAGPLDDHRWLCTMHDHVSRGASRWIVLESGRLGRFALGKEHSPPKHFNGEFLYAGTPGRFALNIEDRIELWDMNRVKPLRTLFRPFNPSTIDGYLFSVQGRSLIILRSTEVIIVENCLRG